MLNCFPWRRPARRACQTERYLRHSGERTADDLIASNVVAKCLVSTPGFALLECHPLEAFAKGYPTPEHLDALERLGACALHRRSFAPVAKKLGLIPEQQDLFAPPKKRAGEAR